MPVAIEAPQPAGVILHFGHPKIACSKKEGLFPLAGSEARRRWHRQARVVSAGRSPPRAPTRRSRRRRSDTERGAVPDVFALATAPSKPKYNRQALEFVSSSEMP